MQFTTVQYPSGRAADAKHMRAWYPAQSSEFKQGSPMPVGFSPNPSSPASDALEPSSRSISLQLIVSGFQT